MTHHDDFRLRPGSDPHYLNIDVAGTEIGYLYLAPDGSVVRSWAHDLKDRDRVTFISRCYTAALQAAGVLAR